MNHRIPSLRLCVAGVIRESSAPAPRILLSLRARDPKKDHWHLPGGGIEFAEPIAAALKRELREELGIEIALTTHRVVDVAEVVEAAENRHVVTLYYEAVIVSGKPTPLDGTKEVGFFDEEAAEKLLITDSSKGVLRKLYGWNL